MDILLGLCLLTSLVSLEYGSMTGERPPLALFLILSLATMAVYWLWFLYLKYAKMESEAAKEVRRRTIGKYIRPSSSDNFFVGSPLRLGGVVSALLHFWLKETSNFRCEMCLTKLVSHYFVFAAGGPWSMGDWCLPGPGVACAAAL